MEEMHNVSSENDDGVGLWIKSINGTYITINVDNILNFLKH